MPSINTNTEYFFKLIIRIMKNKNKNVKANTATLYNNIIHDVYLKNRQKLVISNISIVGPHIPVLVAW